jgi:hypothetical protein
MGDAQGQVFRCKHHSVGHTLIAKLKKWNKPRHWINPKAPRSVG